MHLLTLEKWKVYQSIATPRKTNTKYKGMTPTKNLMILGALLVKILLINKKIISNK